MNKTMLITPVAAILFFSLSLSADNGQETNFNKSIKDIYNFNPSEADEKVLEQKGKDMDKFWELVESDKPVYLPLLRKKLREPGNNRFFYFDGSRLLLKNSEAKEDQIIAVNAIKNTNIKDVDPYVYFQVIHWIGCQGVDTYPAIDNILNTPGYGIFVPDHFLKLGKDYSVLYCVLCIDDSLFLDKLIQRLKIEKNPETAKTIILSIAYTVTEKGQKAINDYAATCTNPVLKEYAGKYAALENKKNLPKKEIKSKRKYFHNFLNDFVSRNYEAKDYSPDEFYKDAFYLVKKGDYSKIKELRKKQAQRVSDEMLSEIDFLTMLLQYSFTSED